MTQELQKRNEILKIEQIKNYMMTQFPEKELVQLPTDENSTTKEDEESFEAPINLETISTDDISMKSVKTDHSTGSLIASALSSQPQNDIPMNADFASSCKYAVIPSSPILESRNCKVHFDLSKKPVLRGSEIQTVSTKGKPPNKMIITKEDLIKLPEKSEFSNPAVSLVSKDSPSRQGSPTNKGGIFEQRKKMFEKSETQMGVQKSRVPRSPRSK